MGLTALVGRLGGSLAPLVALLDGVWPPLPTLAYAGITLLAACIVLLLPETKQAQLPETIQDVERRCVHRTMCVCVSTHMWEWVLRCLTPDTRSLEKTCLYVVYVCMGVRPELCTLHV